ncbi:BQ5605_C016g08261 [Microbotryum silenes-dioicae]|uniref:BQ5605_C016g08261 protein n=1 Tax=Microbotryum silenes-dioicae TaxID=796604 RepID=A0A2X0NZP7_9BASI|nr:BQ5605_C016g08261 [Microbotryum silenes-dioicae]
MTSLADELMNDLDTDSGGEDDQLDAVLGLNGHAGPSTSTSKLNGTTNEASNGAANDDDGQEDEAGDVLMDSTAVGDMMVPEGGVRPTLELNPDDVNAMQLGEVGELAKVTKLANGKTMKDVLSKIAYYREHPDPNLASDGDSQEYRLIVQANNLNVEVDNEMLIVHKVRALLTRDEALNFIKDHYLPRFPELDTLVSAPLPFCRVILALGNGPELRGDLTGLLTSGTVMAVTVTAATSRGQTLDDAEWKVVEGACAMMFQLDDAKRTILEYVESRISLLAPNISAIVGTQTATKVLGIAGGLQGLSRIPHSNIYVLGAVKRATTGFSTAAHSVDRLHTGFIYQCPLVQRTRAEDRMKAQRKVGAKVALACRVDLAGSHPTGQFGEEMLEKLEKEMERLARPAPSKIVKALPRPDEQKKARRGGKRARKAKEAYAQTELRKQQNRMKFGEAEEETGYADETVGMGMIGSSGSGRVRVTDGEARSKAKLSKSAKGRLASIKTSSSATSGLATSLAFTPVQGLELVDPSKLRTKTEEANANWFANDGAFTHVQKGGGFGKSQVKR